MSNKVAVINDTHFGIKNGNDVFIDYMLDFFENQFFPYCLKHGIKEIVHAGDFFDHRKYINFKALQKVNDRFLSKLREYGMLMHIIPGNHDVYWKQTNRLNAIELILSRDWSDVVKIYMEPDDIQFGDTSVAVLPWVTDDNLVECTKFIENTKSEMLIGHLELEGFKFMASTNIISHDNKYGMKASDFEKFDVVLSGHYHTKSQRGNIRYMGTQYELTWSDCNDTKHFHIIDTKTREVTAIHNPDILFYKYVYDDSQYASPEDILTDTDFTKFNGKFVRIVVNKKNDHFVFDKFIMRVESNDPEDLNIFESMEEFSANEVNDEDIKVENTEVLMDSYVDSLGDSDVDINKLKKKLHTLYVEAQNIDSI